MSAPHGRIITETLGGSPLSLAAQSLALPAAIQPWRPSSAAEWRKHLERCRGAANPEWYSRVKGAMKADGPAAERLARVVKGKGVVVTTGQQPGLFGGPLYTLAKALTALELADAIEAATGVPAAPIFWAATDDADFDEAKGAFLSDADGLHELVQTERPEAGTQMSDTPLGNMESHLERLRVTCGSAPNAQYLEAALEAYTKGRTIGGAYVLLLRELLQPMGIAVFDSTTDAYRAAARPILIEALKSADAVAAAVAQRAAAIRAQGFEPQVEDDRGLSLVFVVEQGIKRRLTIAEAGTVSASAVLSPNVLLRPVVEREILPTVAYVGGPGEIAYFPQADAVAAALGRERLSVVPRWSCTIVEAFVARALGRLGVQVDDLKNFPALEKRLARAALSPDVAASWQRLNEQVQSLVRDLARAVEQDRLMPPPVIEGLSRSLAHRLSRAERRLLAAAKRRDAAVRKDLTAAAAAIWPKGKRQERVLNFIPMLARGGEALVTDLRASARDHARQLIGD